jgi:hypothetical protein
MQLLNDFELAGLKQDFKDIVEDPRTNIEVIFRRIISRNTNVGTGQVTEVIDETPLEVWHNDMGPREIAMSGGILRVGDEILVFDPALLSHVPRPEDRVYRTITTYGKVNLVNGSAVLAGIGTRLIKDGVRGGDVLRLTTPGSATAVVKSISADDAGVLKAVWSDPTVPGETFKIYREYEIVQVMNDPFGVSLRLSIRRAGV